ncbi:flagellar biosynthesis anti-sigma factor FlgM [Clostridiaceae bacterium 35-E11]
MKINNNPNVQKILGSYRKNIDNVHKQEKIKQEKDKVEISENARAFQVAMHAFKQLPHIREDKVEEIKKQIASGTYNPSAEEIVNSMFDKKV